MIDERHLNGTTGESKSYTVTNNSNACSTARNLYYEQLQEQSEGDWVKVVRCKDCRFHEHEELGMVWCPNVIGSWIEKNGYCSTGERREDADYCPHCGAKMDEVTDDSK